MNTSTLILSNTTRAALGEYLKSGDIHNNKLVKTADLLTADGVLFTDLFTKAKGGNAEIRAQVLEGLFAGLSKPEQAVALVDVKTLDAEGKKDRKAAKDKPQIYLKKICAYMTPANESETKTDIQRIHKLIDDAITKMQNLVEPSFDVVDLVKRLKSVKGAMPAL